MPDLRARAIKIGAAAALATVMAVGSAVAAFGYEGTRSSYMTDWTVGTRSAVWADANSTTNATTVTLSNCICGDAIGYVSGPSTTQQLQLLRDTGFPLGYQSVGNKDIACNTASWSRPAAGNYVFQLNKWAGTYPSSSPSALFRANPVTIVW